ncbi:hypothetical protein [Novosphingobium malaysiense]|uniref:Uncharacterized protein n=1 Tax=Novosphingobium malaysiense TaxID=1348853 RepID=A0A0B1ZQZ7_9SPHN|nr:hypothetical protein [Novosphingobium malaysiense]KHK91658.1 hypothetical protein LK12_12765 [Novosphingobium malaysiense]
MTDTNRIMAIAGAVSALLAALAWIQDRRRIRRRNLDRVGFMPWTAIFFWALMSAVLLLGLSGRALLGGN